MNKKHLAFLLALTLLLAFQQAANYVDKQGRKQGRFVKYFGNGKVESICYYLNDTLHGPYTAFYTNGNKQIEQMFDRGVRIDTWKSYHVSGYLKKMCVHADTFQTWYVFTPGGKLQMSTRELLIPPYTHHSQTFDTFKLKE